MGWRGGRGCKGVRGVGWGKADQITWGRMAWEGWTRMTRASTGCYDVGWKELHFLEIHATAGDVMRL